MKLVARKEQRVPTKDPGVQKVPRVQRAPSILRFPRVSSVSGFLRALEVLQKGPKSPNCHKSPKYPKMAKSFKCLTRQ